MNIFVLDTDPVLAAQMHCDKHVVKMILETAQILSTVWHQQEARAHYAIPAEAYRPTHRNHPCVKWAGRSSGNYAWLWRLGIALCDEFELRYGHGHKTRAVLSVLSIRPPSNVPFGAITRPELCMPEDFAADYLTYRGIGMSPMDAVVQCYREYYRTAKAHLLTYTNRQRPG